LLSLSLRVFESLSFLSLPLPLRDIPMYLAQTNIDDIVCSRREQLCKDRINELLSFPETLFVSEPNDPQAAQKCRDVKQLLRKLLDRLKPSGILIHYKHKELNFGRLYPDPYASATLLPSDIRSFLVVQYASQYDQLVGFYVEYNHFVTPCMGCYKKRPISYPIWPIRYVNQINDVNASNMLSYTP
jgi:hypothetical protein